MQTALPAKYAHSINEAALAIDSSRTVVYELISSGKLKARKMRGRTVILDEDLREFLAGLPVIEPKEVPDESDQAEVA